MTQVKISAVYTVPGPIVYTRCPEEGSTLAIELPQLVAETAAGRIFVYSLQSLVTREDSEGFSRKQARFSRFRLDALAEKIGQDGKINLEYWYETSEEDFRHLLRGAYGDALAA